MKTYIKIDARFMASIFICLLNMLRYLSLHNTDIRYELNPLRLYVYNYIFKKYLRKILAWN